MRIPLAILCLAGALWAQDYSRLYSGTDVQLPGPAPFSASDPINTCRILPDLSKAKMCRVTGPEWNSLCPVSFAATQGGTGDTTTNTTGTLMTVTCNGATFIIGFNPNTLQVTTVGPAKIVNRCVGNPTWSRVDPQILYCRPYKSTQVLAMRILDPSQPATATTVVDFAKCHGASAADVVTGSALGVGQYDQVFTADLSWAGNQNTSHLQFAYDPAIGCTTLDTAGNGVNPVVYFPDGTAAPARNAFTWQPVVATWQIHDSQTNGVWLEASIASNTCAGLDCGKGDAGVVWLIGSNTLEMMSESPVSSGHGGLMADLVLNMGNPNLITRRITDMAHRWNLFTYPTCCQDHHFSLSHKSDSDPIFDVTGGPFIIGTPGAYYNELVILQGGKALRPGHHYSSGTPAAGFEGEFGIGAPNQPQTVYSFTSDMGGALGNVLQGTQVFNRADVFVIGLVGQ